MILYLDRVCLTGLLSGCCCLLCCADLATKRALQDAFASIFI